MCGNDQRRDVLKIAPAKIQRSILIASFAIGGLGGGTRNSNDVNIPRVSTLQTALIQCRFNFGQHHTPWPIIRPTLG